MLERIGHFVHFALLSLPAAMLAVRRPRELLRQLHVVLIGAMPLGLAAGFSLGIVVWIHLHEVVTEFVHKVPEYLALAVVLEFAPLGAGLVVAGRSGASLGAELSSMKLSEQIDALEVMGLSPMRQLVGPRVLACMIALPVLTVYIGIIAITGSYLAEMIGGGISSTQYQNDIWRGLAQGKFVPSTLKTVVFGYLIAVTGCYTGMNADGGAEGIGKAATQSVVGSILLVLLANVLLARMIQIIWPLAA
jgi:phospholipid/cholesterol/gamma-HCH transport system permease protein